MGIAICYDSEFPQYIQTLIQAGAQFILIPSYTDSPEGFYRVHIAARARAMENQCYTIHACARGQVSCLFLDGMANGHAGVFTPIDTGFPTDGILSMDQESTQQWIISDIHLQKIVLFDVTDKCEIMKISYYWMKP